MSRNYWVISDTHFFHANSLKWGRNEVFSSVEEMNETMVSNWNSVVRPGDKVYHLGDVLMGPSSPVERNSLMGRLAGSKRLIVGNHDDVKYMVQNRWFQKIQLWKVFNEFNCIMTHVPIHQDSLVERLAVRGGFNLHGHTHFDGSPEGPYRSACVELNNYTPVNLETLRDEQARMF